MNKAYLALLLGAISLILAWHFPACTGLAFVAFAPLLYYFDQKKLPFRKRFAISYLFIFLWQIGSTFWLFRTNVVNVALLNLINSLLPALILAAAFQLKPTIKRRFPIYAGILLAWLSLEFAQHNSQLSFPLLTLGNVLGNWPGLIQWYEWTGVLGGTIWIWLFNFAALELFLAYQQDKRFSMKTALFPSLTLVLPIAVSLFLGQTTALSNKNVEIVTVHPDLDCYTEKYDWPIDTVVDRHLALSLSLITEHTSYVVWPENAIPDGGWTNTIAEDPLWQRIADSLAAFPKVQLITGAVLYHPVSQAAADRDPLIHFQEHTNTHFRTYNGVVQLSKGQAPQIRTKQQLVAFEETLPYSQSLHFLDGVIPSLGKFAFSASTANQHVFRTPDGLASTPLICYETAFGESTAQYVRQGAKLLFVILNEGWYQNKFGARQFMRLSQIRAIETRRAVARSSNFGASGFIDPYGNIVSATDEFEATALRQRLPMQSQITLYVRYGDYLGYLAVVLFVAFLVWIVSLRTQSKAPNKRPTKVRKRQLQRAG
ncbi:MAG: apolipoprotein N-acyltransferase [Bacteroidota bacterium]